jgi:hypothetical protein
MWYNTRNGITQVGRPKQNGLPDMTDAGGRKEEEMEKRLHCIME